MEQVNHPRHYNRHPTGIECIEIIRHYTCDTANALKYLWRAGLKQEMGKKDREKEIEDLKKALWYVDDCNLRYNRWCFSAELPAETMDELVLDVTGHTVEEITRGYDEKVSRAMRLLLRIGLVSEGSVFHSELHGYTFVTIEKNIRKRIAELHRAMTDNDEKDEHIEEEK